MEKIVCIIILILYWIVMFMMCYIIAFRKKKNTINNVHFYVIRDKYDNVLRLYLGKPYRDICGFYTINKGCFVTRQEYFPDFGLDKNDFKNLKFEDEPIEVLLNLE